MTDNEDDGKSDDKIVSLRGNRDAPRTYDRTIIDGGRRYAPNACPHRGPYLVSREFASVECGDCGAKLNPIYVLEILANREAYWNMRQKDLSKHLDYLNKEIEGRTRTKCTHCGNMTAIRFGKELPLTWAPTPY